MLAADNVKVTPVTAPAFAVRRWSLTHLQGPFEDFRRYDNWATLLQNAAFDVKRYIDLAGQFDISSIELTGRPGEGGIDLSWLTNYEAFDRCRRTGLEAELIRHRQDIVRQISRWCGEKSLPLWIWHHELYLPPEFYQGYPEITGTNYPVCFSHPLVGEAIEAKIGEFLAALPDVAGLVLSMSECAGVEITSDQGCQCPKCRRMDIPTRLRMMVDHVRQPLKAAGKGLVVRTFSHARYREVLRHTETENMMRAFEDLPEDVILMSKYCSQDFFGSSYPDNALIGAFKNPHLVEFTLNREITGGTWTPNCTYADFAARIKNAGNKGCLGVVGRVDNPTSSDDPYITIDHPNAFNLYCFSRLGQDPDTPSDDIWRDYLTQRYPRADHAQLRQALEPTQEMGDKIYLTLGCYGISYAHRIPHAHQIDSTLEFLSLAKWRPDWLETHNRIQNHDPSLIRAILQEKDEAIAIAERSLSIVESLRGQLDDMEYLQMKLGFVHAGQAGRLWRGISEVYFLARCIGADTSDDLNRLCTAVLELFDLVGEIRRDFGHDAWPTCPGPMRGVTCEQFVVEAYRPIVYRFMNSEVPRLLGRKYTDMQTLTELFPRYNVEHLWRMLLGQCDADGDQTGCFVNLDILPPLTEVTVAGRELRVTNSSGQYLTLPLMIPVAEPVTLAPGRSTIGIGPYDDPLRLTKR